VALATGTLGGLALCAAAPWLAAHALAAPHLAGRLRIGAVSIFLTALNGAQAGALSGLEAFRAMAWVNLANGLVALPVLVAGTYLGSLAGTLWANCVVQVVAWLLYHRALRAEAHRRGVPFAWTGCLREWEVLHRFSLPAIFSNALVALVTWYCYTLLINRAGGYAEMGIFNAANQWRTAILFLPGALATIVLPLLSNLRGAGDHGAYRLIFWANVYINALVGLAAVVPVALLAPWIMARYGAGFREGWPVLVLLALSAVPAGVNGVVGQAIASAGKMWLGCLFNGLWAAAMLGSAVSATGRWGAAGLASATLLSYVLHTGWQALYVGSLRGAPAPPPGGTAAGAPLREDML
jgi:O-antigen/teichoic acid export membrane protein